MDWFFPKPQFLIGCCWLKWSADLVISSFLLKWSDTSKRESLLPTLNSLPFKWQTNNEQNNNLLIAYENKDSVYLYHFPTIINMRFIVYHHDEIIRFLGSRICLVFFFWLLGSLFISFLFFCSGLTSYSNFALKVWLHLNVCVSVDKSSWERVCMCVYVGLLSYHLGIILWAKSVYII